MFLNRFTRLRGVGRYACLGTAVLETLGRKYKMHNMQKGRVDYLLDVAADASLVCQPDRVTPFLARDYIAPTIEQQALLCPAFRPELVFVDSFSDLTDQLFRHKSQGWSFCCNYQDMQHDDGFADDFESLGLLDLDTLQARYTRILQIINARWGGIPIIYLHFPDALESRERFVERARMIRRIVDVCAATVSNLYSFSVPSAIVKPPSFVESGMANFPYHYSQETYDMFAEMIRMNGTLKRFFGSI